MSRSILSIITAFALLFGAIHTSGCGMSGGQAAVGGLGGAAVGAGTGAIIGSVIANGDVAASALLGGAVGIPIGLAIMAIYVHNTEKSVRERKIEVIEKNQRDIYARQREIDALRDQIRADGPTGNPAEEYRQYQYDGETIGNYYR